MRGGGRYKSHTRIGNWYEEIAVEESKQADFQRKVSNGNLLLRNHQGKKSQCMQDVPLSFSEDGTVKFGDYVTLVHDSTSVQLACDPFDDIFPPWNKFQVSGVPAGRPVARTTFRIVKPPPSFKSPLTDDSDGVLKYGQAFSIICNESLRYTEDSAIRDPDLYLSSSLKNDRNATKGSNRQCAYLAAAHNADAVWYCMRPSKGRDPSNERFVAVGHPVHADYSFVLTHHSSNTFLKADLAVKEFTDFGVEVEVCAEKTGSVGKLGIVVSEREGSATPQTLTKPDVPSNLWHFEYADNPAAAEDRRVIPPVASCDTILRDMKRKILYGGIFAMVEFRRKVMDTLRGADSTREVSSIVHREDARIALMNAGCEYKDLHFDLVLDYFDRRKSGHVDIFIILKHIAELTDEDVECDFSSRDAIVSRKYSDLSNRKKGLTVDALAERFHPEELPFVQSEQYTAAEARNGFKIAFPQMRKAYEAPIVKLNQFAAFFVDIGASITDDSYFNDIVNSCFY